MSDSRPPRPRHISGSTALRLPGVIEQNQRPAEAEDVTLVSAKEAWPADPSTSPDLSMPPMPAEFSTSVVIDEVWFELSGSMGVDPIILADTEPVAVPPVPASTQSARPLPPGPASAQSARPLPPAPAPARAKVKPPSPPSVPQLPSTSPVRKAAPQPSSPRPQPRQAPPRAPVPPPPPVSDDDVTKLSVRLPPDIPPAAQESKAAPPVPVPVPVDDHRPASRMPAPASAPQVQRPVQVPAPPEAPPSVPGPVTIQATRDSGARTAPPEQTVPTATRAQGNRAAGPGAGKRRWIWVTGAAGVVLTILILAWPSGRPPSRTSPAPSAPPGPPGPEPAATPLPPPAPQATATPVLPRPAPPAVAQGAPAAVPNIPPKELARLRKLLERCQLKGTTEEMLAQVGDVVETRLDLGACAVKADRFEEGLRHYQIALDRRKDEPWAFLGLGRAYERHGDLQDALLWYRKFQAVGDPQLKEMRPKVQQTIARLEGMVGRAGPRR